MDTVTLTTDNAIGSKPSDHIHTRAGCPSLAIITEAAGENMNGYTPNPKMYPAPSSALGQSIEAGHAPTLASGHTTHKLPDCVRQCKKNVRKTRKTLCQPRTCAIAQTNRTRPTLNVVHMPTKSGFAVEYP
ncbi:MAG: hypothetical protein IH987_22035 [Planctomycetes bacterium]|nr:hypothetical protein [Planctomycetota bacterium]